MERYNAMNISNETTDQEKRSKLPLGTWTFSMEISKPYIN